MHEFESQSVGSNNVRQPNTGKVPPEVESTTSVVRLTRLNQLLSTYVGTVEDCCSALYLPAFWNSGLAGEELRRSLARHWENVSHFICSPRSYMRGRYPEAVSLVLVREQCFSVSERHRHSSLHVGVIYGSSAFQTRFTLHYCGRVAAVQDSDVLTIDI